MLINLSNHPFPTWTENQRSAAINLFDKVKDIPFPEIDPGADLTGIDLLAQNYLGLILSEEVSGEDLPAVHLMGEFSFVFRLLLLLKSAGIKAFCSTTRRLVKLNDDGTKTIKFEFVKFREYF